VSVVGGAMIYFLSDDGELQIRDGVDSFPSDAVQTEVPTQWLVAGDRCLIAVID